MAASKQRETFDGGRIAVIVPNRQASGVSQAVGERAKENPLATLR
jgi:hypothetical protein